MVGQSCSLHGSSSKAGRAGGRENYIPVSALMTHLLKVRSHRVWRPRFFFSGLFYMYTYIILVLENFIYEYCVSIISTLPGPPAPSHVPPHTLTVSCFDYLKFDYYCYIYTYNALTVEWCSCVHVLRAVHLGFR